MLCIRRSSRRMVFSYYAIRLDLFTSGGVIMRQKFPSSVAAVRYFAALHGGRR